MTVTVYQDSTGAWRWRLQSGNGEVVSDSAGGYESKGWAVHMATSLHPDATVHLEDRNGLTEEDD